VTTEAFKVNRVVGLPLGVVDPLLWLALTSGGLWIFVAVDVREHLTTPGTSVDQRIAQLAVAVASVLLLNGLAGLLYSQFGGPIARGLCAAAGVGLVASGWLFTQVPEIGSGLASNLFAGSLVAGVGLVVSSAVPWRQLEISAQRPTGVLLTVAALGIAAVAVTFRLVIENSGGLVQATPDSPVPSWDRIIPAWLVTTGLLASMSQVWGRRYIAAAATVAAAIVASVLAVPPSL
jgi:hypothetical protein